MSRPKMPVIGVMNLKKLSWRALKGFLSSKKRGKARCNEDEGHLTHCAIAWEDSSFLRLNSILAVVQTYRRERHTCDKDSPM